MGVLVTGAAGYIGSHMLLALHDAGEQSIGLDNLSTGVEWLVPKNVPLIVADVGDEKILRSVIENHDIREVIHFAGSILVPESIKHPLDYYSNNTENTSIPDALVSTHVVSSMLALLRWWVENGMAISAEQMAEYASELVIRPLQGFTGLAVDS